jgi:short-subunit dehydrogenase
MARGRIVNIGAATAQTTVPFFGPISASKAALASITDAMRMELKTFGIKVVLIEPGAIATTIFAKSGAAQEAALNTAPPERTLIYRPAIEAMRKVTAKSGADKISVVVEAVVAALTVRTPKPRVLIGKGASQLAFLRHLPIRIRDSLLMRSLGIKQPLEAAARSLISAGTAVPAPSLRSGSSDETDWQEKGTINVQSQR